MTIETKYFTPSEARRTLPLVKKVVKDILDTSREMRLIAEEIGATVEDDPRIRKMADDIEKFMLELEEIGCFFKDWNFTIGLVDFPAMIDGKEVRVDVTDGIEMVVSSESCIFTFEASAVAAHGLSNGVCRVEHKRSS